MEKILICYKFENLPLSKRNQFKRALFGAKEKTHGGKYTAITKGFLSDKYFEKPVRSVIIIDNQDKEEVLQILEKFNATIQIYRILPIT